jgi:hypothetical protein
MKRNDIREIQVGDEFYCRRESGREYTGTVRAVRVVRSNRETMVTVYMGRDDDDAEVYRNFYPCDCVEWSAETPEPVYG